MPATEQSLAARNAARDAQAEILDLARSGAEVDGPAVYSVLLGLYLAGLESR